MQRQRIMFLQTQPSNKNDQSSSSKRSSICSRQLDNVRKLLAEPKQRGETELNSMLTDLI